MAELNLLGTTLSAKESRPCGLCGQFRIPTRTHVPPQTAGNRTAVRRAPDIIDVAGVRRPGRWSEGGLWVRGLCEQCNNLAGRTCDKAYADFATQVTRMSTPLARTLQVIPNEAPGVFFSPHLVAKCVLFGMFSIHPRLRIIFPDLAKDLAQNSDVVRWPRKVELRVGRSHPAVERQALLSSGIWMMRVLAERIVHFSFADVVFPPLAWFLVPIETSREMGPQLTHSLVDASDWIRYSADRVNVDLRSIARSFPSVLHPMFSPDRDSWIEAISNSGTDADTVVVFGRIPSNL